MKQLLRVVAFIIFSSAFVQAQTIADLARRERARLQSAPKTVVIRNDDLKSASGPKADDKPAAEATPPTAAAEAAEGPAAPAGPGGHDEKWWRGQFEKVREETQRLETQLPLLESNLSTANREFLTRSYDPDGRGKKAIDDAKSKLDEAKSGLAKGQEKVTQLEEELRRAGGPAGWAR